MTKAASTPTPIFAGANIILIAPVCWAIWCRIAFCRLMFATGNPEFPTRVVCLGTKNVHADAGSAGHDASAIAPNHRDCRRNSPAV